MTFGSRNQYHSPNFLSSYKGFNKSCESQVVSSINSWGFFPNTGCTQSGKTSTKGFKTNNLSCILGCGRINCVGSLFFCRSKDNDNHSLKTSLFGKIILPHASKSKSNTLFPQRFDLFLPKRISISFKHCNAS